MNDANKMTAACYIVARIIRTDPNGVIAAVNSSAVYKAQVNQTMFNLGYRWDGNEWKQKVPPMLERIAKGLIDDDDNNNS